MPVYEFELDDGRRLKIEGDTPPTDDDIYGLLVPKPYTDTQARGALGDTGFPVPQDSGQLAAQNYLRRQQSPWLPTEGVAQGPMDMQRSLLGISPEDIPSGADTTHPEITIPLSAVGKTAAGVAGYMTSPQGIGEMAAATVAAPAVFAKWAYDMLKGGAQSIANVGTELRYMITEGIANKTISVNQLGPKPEGISTQEHVQNIVDNSLNAAVSLIGGGASGLHAAKLGGELLPQKGPNAIPIRGPETLPLDARPEGGQEVGGRVPGPKEPALPQSQVESQVQPETQGVPPELPQVESAPIPEPTPEAVGQPQLAASTPEPSPTTSVETQVEAPKVGEGAVAKVESEVQKVARTEGQRPAKEVKTELVSRLEEAVKDSKPESPEAVKLREEIAKAYSNGRSKLGDSLSADLSAELGKTFGKTTIDIPGDGTFTIWNTKEALGTVLERAKRISTKSSEPTKVKYIGTSKEDKAWVESQKSTPPPTEPLNRFQELTRRVESGDKLTAKERREYLKLREQATGKEPEKPEVVAGEGPGSPSIGQGPDVQTGQLRQLTDFIRTQSISPKEPIGTRISQALNVADRWAKGKDAVTQGLGRARAVSRALLDAYTNLPPWRKFEETIGRWIGADQKTSLEVRDFQKTINKSVPSRLRQEAITNWIQADGNEALLRERAAASRPALRKGYEAALTLNDSEKTLARNIGSYLEARLQEGQQAGLLKQGVDNYVTQIWKRSNTATQRMWADLFGAGTLNPNFKYARQRIFDSYFDGEQAGYAPRDKRIGSLISAYDLAFNRALSARAMIKELHDGTAADGMPITMTSGKTSPIPNGEAPPEAFLIKPNQAPKGAVTEDGRPYRPIDHWALRDWKWATKGPEGQNVFVQGDMLVHPDHWQHLNNILKSSRLQQNPVTRFALQSGALAKQTKLSLSPFHPVQEGVHAMSHRINPANTVKVDLNDPIQRGLVDHGLMVSDPRGQELFSEGMTGGGLVGKIPGLGHLQVAFNDILFKDYIPRLKMSMALDALERNREAYAGKASDDQIQALTAREANAAFGEQNYKMMGRSPTVQDFFRLTLLAPDFLEARARFVGQALKPFGREQRIALGLMAATMYVGSRILNKVLDDDYHLNKPFSVIYHGKEYRLRTLLGDVQHLITDPRTFWYNRMSPWLRTASEYVTGRDDRGIKRSSMEQLADAAKWFQPIPTQTRSDQTLGQSILQSAGIGGKSYTAQTQLYEMLDKWKSKQTDPRIVESYDRERKETHADSPYMPLRHALVKGDQQAALDAYKKLLPSHTPKQIDQAFRSNKPFSGSIQAERKFIASLDEEGKKLYAKAISERKDLYMKFRAVRSALQ